MGAATRRSNILAGVKRSGRLTDRRLIQVAAAARYAMEAGVRIIGPECAIPLRTPLENLKAVVQGVEGAV
jgi:hypothetical protein